MFLDINWEAMWNMAIEPAVVLVAVIAGASAVYLTAEKLYRKFH